MTSIKNPKIIHRVYCPTFKPFYDPYERYLESWKREMPDYDILKWNEETIDLSENAWLRLSNEHKSPVFISEYVRWWALRKFGGLYLDADCEVLNGQVLDGIVSDLYADDSYDIAFGIEAKENGYPTAQTMAAKPGAELVDFMCDLYEHRLPPLFNWRNSHALIGPRLMGLYMQEKGINLEHDGFFVGLEEPVIIDRMKIYPQTYFSPKFSLVGETLDYQAGKTCVYHMFGNANVDFSKRKLHRLEKARNDVLTFDEYRAQLDSFNEFPRRYDFSHFNSTVGAYNLEDDQEPGLMTTGKAGPLAFGPYVSLPKGRYECTFKFSDAGKMQHIEWLRITAGKGAAVLANLRPDPSASEARLEFVVPEEGGTDIEFVVDCAESLEADVHSPSVFQEVVVAVAPEPVAPAPAKFSALNGAQTKSAPYAASPTKVIHRIYFNFQGGPDIFAGYLENWEEKLPGYEIKHWDASNLPMDINPWVKKLHAQGDHAFLSDYFRWYLLREYGGIYLDADIEIVSGDNFDKIISDLETALDYDAVIGIDERNGGWYTAHSMAARPGSNVAKYMCDLYSGLAPLLPMRKKHFFFFAPQLTSMYFADHGHNYDHLGSSPDLEAPVVRAGVRVLPQDWLSPLTPAPNCANPFMLNALTANTALCHHFACTWHEEDSAFTAYSSDRGGKACTKISHLLQRGELVVYAADSGQIASVVGTTRNGAIATTGKTGYLTFGPYLTLFPGKYAASFTLEDAAKPSLCTMDVTANKGQTVFGTVTWERRSPATKTLRVEFELTETVTDLEIRLHVSRKTRMAVKKLTIHPQLT